MSLTRSAVFGGLLSAAVAPLAGDNAVTQIGLRFDWTGRLTLGLPTASVGHPDTANPARYLRVRLRLVGGGQGRWYLTVRDASHRPQEVLRPEDFLPDGRRWTGRVPGAEVRLDLRAADDTPETRNAEVAIEEYIVMPTSAGKTYYSLQDEGHPRYKPLFPGEAGAPPAETDTARQAMGDAVGFVMSSHGQKPWCCSGIAVADDLLLTNWHCGAPPEGLPPALHWGQVICAATLVDLSWDGDGLSREFACREVLAQDRERDYALLRIAPVGPAGRPRPARLRATPPVANEPLVVIHHPVCEPKRVSDACSVVDAAYRAWVGTLAGVDLTHKCDTETGSSGGGVFDAQGRVVGLHHRGFTESDDADAKTRRVNAAVRMDRIVEHLRTVRPDIAARLSVVP